ncbi:MAG: TonB-dependent receptor domain-containing protein, partial [Candidatus Binatia bacterium]
SDALGTRLYFTYVENDQEFPGALSRAQFKEDPDQGGTDVLQGDFQKDVETWRLASKTTWQLVQNQRLDFGFSYEEQTLFHPIVADFGGDNPFFDGLLIDTDHRDVGAMVRYEQQIANHNLLFGANYRVGEVEGEQFGNNGGERGDLQTLVEQEADTLQAYFMDRWRIGEHWTLVPGVQFVNAHRELNNISVTNPLIPGLEQTLNRTDGDYSSVNPRLGVIYHVQPEFDLFANVSRLYEPPTNFELEDQVTGGDEALDAMEGTVVEVGTRGKHPIGRTSSWEWNLALYYAWINNEILSVEDPAQPGDFLTSNVDDTLHAGIEALVTAHFALDADGVHAIEPIISLTVNEFKFDDHSDFGDNDLPAAPGYVVKAEVLYRHANGFYAGPTFDVVDDRFADFANSYRVDSYTLL